MTGLDDYINWKAEDGLPFDAWLRVHIKPGAKVIKVCDQYKKIRGTVAEWEKWTAMRFPQSGKYVVPGALSPVEMDVEKDNGIYIEPDLWIVHDL